MNRVISGFNVIKKLRGNLNIHQGENTSIEVKNLDGETISPGSKVLDYAETYNIISSVDTGYKMSSLDINGESYLDKNTYTYLPISTLDVNITSNARQLETFTISTNLVNCTIDNLETSILEDSSFNAVVIPEGSYALYSAEVTIMMGQSNITTDVYSNGVITIEKVTGDISISINLTEEITSTPINLFKFNGTQLTEYIGDLDTIVIPSSYSYSTEATERTEVLSSMSEVNQIATITNYVFHIENDRGAYYNITTYDEFINYRSNINRWFAYGYVVTATYAGRDIIDGNDYQIKSISDTAFENKGAILKSITLPRYLTNIYGWPFRFSPNLETVKIHSLNEKYVDIGNSVMDRTTKNVMVGVKSPVLPEGVEGIGNYAFYDRTSLTELNLPSTFKGFYGNDIFHGCTNLTRVNVPSLETWLNIDMSDSYGFKETNQPLYYGASLYIDNVLAEDIVIPDSITRLKDGAFAYCQSLKTINLNKIIASGEDCFLGCNNLIYTTNPEDTNLKYLGNNENPYYMMYGVIDTSVTTANISNNTKLIGGGAFFKCESINNIVLPTDLIHLGSHAFSWCKALKRMVVPQNITVLEKYTFNVCESITSVTLPNNLKEIHQGAFSGCSSLPTLTIPNTVEFIDTYAFQSCDVLTTLTFPDSLNRVGNSLLQFSTAVNFKTYDTGKYISSPSTTYFTLVEGDSSVTSLTIHPDTKIIAESFFGYSKLVDITIPQNVIFAKISFSNCFELSSITFERTTPPDGINANNISSRVKVYCPIGSEDLYKAIFAKQEVIGI